jgi:NTE family protein
MIENLVFSGCGTKLYSFLGFLRYLNETYEEFNKNIRSVIGTSAGSFIALLICLNYSYNEIEKILINLKINKFKNIKADNILNFFDNYGIDDGNYFNKVFKIVVKAKTGNEKTTFKELFEFSNKKLIITAVCLNKFKTEYFSYETHPDMDIITAIMMSGCVPFFLKPILHEDCYYVDGALLNHYPICYFDKELDKTYGILVSDILDETAEIKNIKDYILAIISCQFINSIRNCYDKYKNNTVILELNESFLDFDIEYNKKMELLENAYKHTKIFFDNKNNISEKKVDIIEKENIIA